MTTSLRTDISIIFGCRLVFILIFALKLFVKCISTSDSPRLSIIANLYLTLICILMLIFSIVFVFVSVSMVVLVLVQIFVLMH